LGASAVVAVLILVETVGFFAQSARAERLVKRAVEQNGSDDQLAGEAIARSCVLADGLKKANLFSPPEHRQNPVTAVAGILGDEVLIGDKWYKAGDMVQDARIVAVEPTQVLIEWDGKEKAFCPLGATDQSSSEKSGRTGRSTRLVARAGSDSGKSPQVVETERAGASTKKSGPQKIDKSQQKVEKQKLEKEKLTIEKKELARASRGDVKKPQPDKKKSTEEIRKAREKAAEKKARKLARK